MRRCGGRFALVGALLWGVTAAADQSLPQAGAKPGWSELCAARFERARQELIRKGVPGLSGAVELLARESGGAGDPSSTATVDSIRFVERNERAQRIGLVYVEAWPDAPSGRQSVWHRLAAARDLRDPAAQTADLPPAIGRVRTGRIGVISTRNAVLEGAFRRAIDDCLAMPARGKDAQ